MIGLDTNILLRWLIDGNIAPDDAPEQAALFAETLLDQRKRFFVNNIVLAETMWLLEKKLKQPKEVVADVVRRLLAATNVVMERREPVEAALTGYEAGRIGFVDHLIGAINAACGCTTTLTFDRLASRTVAFTRLESGQ